MRSPHRLLDVFVTDDTARRHPDLVQQAGDAGVRLTVVTDRVAATLSETVHPQGATAIVELPASDIHTALAPGLRLAVLLVGVADPGNAGTVIRTAAAVGADAVVFCGSTVDPYGPKCVRASAGAVLHVPIVVGADLGSAVRRLHDAGVQIFAAALAGEDLFSMGEELSRPTAWLFGGEAHGLDPEHAAMADRLVHVPMTSRVESLNLAAAAAVCLYASRRAGDVAP
jgi:RNA methyltransferase, TrmH family